MLDPFPFSLFPNPRAGTPGTVVLPAGGFRRARAEITSWPGYAPTPLRDLEGLAGAARVGAIRFKDESGRFGLGSFKALGGAYAVAQLLVTELARRGVASAATTADLLAGRHAEATRDITVTCATDGNHGRSVAWGAQRFGCRCVIFVHAAVSQARLDAIVGHGAEVRRVPGTYDDAVREAAMVAADEGWFVVSDTSWPGYTTVPVDVMQGYRVMADEAADQWSGAPPTHVFMQGGVGGAAAAVSVQMRARYAPAPRFVVVEPDRAACLLASAELGAPAVVPGDLDTLMAGLACGEPSLLAWTELERAATAFMAVPDEAAIACMRLLARRGIVAGESAVAGLAGFLLAAADPAARATLGLTEASRVLLFGTEGATDPLLYRRLVGETA
ncbi:Diaminopropionate ammonia-lyase [Rhodovastum atsumiense]|uniref:Diaminopropionate ammonia-lyase n=1 Tax=Rhodovastum atsumiense TaxID=504468 RepID=A0A5M6IL78_9PROT|nr:diaminopropionate ammonia-lyase [Rhodovastum atsumiense]KAA5609016.1 diaminopropionate ammonia-lyase [Rhodovastum atsumiense]CAH2599066.1 Diaminopropionate ammonia-lyase [Rhodovastum atsumiense]